MRTKAEPVQAEGGTPRCVQPHKPRLTSPAISNPTLLACRAGDKRSAAGAGLFEAPDSPTVQRHLPPPPADERRGSKEAGEWLAAVRPAAAQLGGHAPAAGTDLGFGGIEGRHGGKGTQVVAAPELAHVVEGCAVPEPGGVGWVGCGEARGRAGRPAADGPKAVAQPGSPLPRRMQRMLCPAAPRGSCLPEQAWPPAAPLRPLSRG